ncbi:bromo and FHA domain-containing protein DDB_G0267958-like [Eurytemora carolleeae]|uniref:bromo and FHA domain-containing protein DDB_G0267958-like n=1 Tax=Eurytemora carolleeae TaxID=1294199 RepID=UPI000C782B62|nr:bromo and FHA domain-containing protein DDB_G0267958-like [Eurytemora carolleeae]|eukprot:XP_023335237.1 bromo and FHA domain-containing protein DDB_G0267958-like [Eurytemora affinis]
MAIERFQAFAVYRDHRHVTRKFSIAWFLSSWTLAVCFVVILVAQISTVSKGEVLSIKAETIDIKNTMPRNALASQLFPGPHSEPTVLESTYVETTTTTTQPTTQQNENSTSFVCTRLLNEGVKCEYENDEDEDESGTDETMDVNSLIDEEEEQNDYPLEAVFPSAIEEEPDDDEKSTKSPEENNGSVSSSTVSSSNSTSTNISGSVEGILTTERGIDSSTPLSIFPDRSPATKQMMTQLPTKTTPSMTKQLPSTIPTSTGAYDAKILIKARKGLTRKKRNVIIKHNKNLEKEVAEELADKIFRDAKNSIQNKHLFF